MGDFSRISDYLGKFRNRKSEKGVAEKRALSAIYKTTGIVLENKEIDVRGSALFIRAAPAVKNEIFFKREEVLATLRALGSRIATIR